jgi:uncharacterized protein YjiS (DUF1127 family)
MTADIFLPVRHFGAAALTVIEILSACHDRHLQRCDLAELDDRALADIGLARDAVERECAKPFWR